MNEENQGAANENEFDADLTDVQAMEPTGCEVLIVDDKATIRMILAAHIRQLGHNPTLALDGKDALKQLEARKFDLVLLDVIMPEMDGYTVLEKIKQDPHLREIPVIMISGVDELESVVRCIEAGAEDYLPKPFQLTLLRARVRACLEKKHLWDELGNRYDQLKNLEKLRDNLTHMIVHDLRTPLTSLLMGMQTLNSVGELDPLQHEVLTLSMRSGQTLLEMINDLLDISKIEAGQVALDYSDVSVPPLIDHCLNQVKNLIDNRKLRVTTDIQCDLSPISVDNVKIQRVIINLLGNAIKFTPSGGSITIEVRASDENTLLFAVKDTGPGIPPEAFERVFEKFGQVESGPSAKMMSTGLGLTFCKMVVEAHGGHIWVESVLGKGSNFLFTLPIYAR